MHATKTLLATHPLREQSTRRKTRVAIAWDIAVESKTSICFIVQHLKIHLSFFLTFFSHFLYGGKRCLTLKASVTPRIGSGGPISTFAHVDMHAGRAIETRVASLENALLNANIFYLIKLVLDNLLATV